jgi:hypothetical protein
MSQHAGPTEQFGGLRPGQFSLRGLFAVMTVTAVFVAAASGAFGKLVQVLAIVLLMYFGGFLAAVAFGILVVVLTALFCVLPIQLWQRCCGRRSGREGGENYVA